MAKKTMRKAKLSNLGKRTQGERDVINKRAAAWKRPKRVPDATRADLLIVLEAIQMLLQKISEQLSQSAEVRTFPVVGAAETGVFKPATEQATPQPEHRET